MTTNYEAASKPSNTVTIRRYLIDIVGWDDEVTQPDLEQAQIHAILAVADELRAIKELLVNVTGVTGGFGAQGRAFVRVFDEAP